MQALPISFKWSIFTVNCFFRPLIIVPGYSLVVKVHINPFKNVSRFVISNPLWIDLQKDIP